MLMRTELTACRLSQGIVHNIAKNQLMNDRSPCYLEFLLRLLCITGDEDVAWRASLEDAHSGERRGFADLTSLWAFLEAQMAERVKSAGEDDSR